MGVPGNVVPPKTVPELSTAPGWAHDEIAVGLGDGERTLSWGGWAWDAFVIPAPRGCRAVGVRRDAVSRLRRPARLKRRSVSPPDLATLWRLASRWYEGFYDSLRRD